MSSYTKGRFTVRDIDSPPKSKSRKIGRFTVTDISP